MIVIIILSLLMQTFSIAAEPNNVEANSTIEKKDTQCFHGFKHYFGSCCNQKKTEEEVAECEIQIDPSVLSTLPSEMGPDNDANNEIGCIQRIVNYFSCGTKEKLEDQQEANSQNISDCDMPIDPTIIDELPKEIANDEDERNLKERLAGYFELIPKKLGDGKNYIFKKISTPTGTTIIAVVYSGAQAVTNFGWAFNWTRLGIDATTALKISEGFGIATAGLCVALGVMVPVVVFI